MSAHGHAECSFYATGAMLKALDFDAKKGSRNLRPSPFTIVPREMSENYESNCIMFQCMFMSV